MLLQSRVMLQGKKYNSTEQTTPNSKKRKATNSLAKNCPTRRTTHAKTCTGEDVNEPLMRSDIPVLVQEVVSMLIVQGVDKLLDNSSTLKSVAHPEARPKHWSLQVRFKLFFTKHKKL